MHEVDRFPQPNARYRDTHGRIVTNTRADEGFCGVITREGGIY